MKRRAAILALLCYPLSRFTAMSAVHAQGRAYLTLDLDKWAGIEVKLGAQKTFVSAADLFAALKGAPE